MLVSLVVAIDVSLHAQIGLTVVMIRRFDCVASKFNSLTGNATLLNCWKFLKLYRTKLRRATFIQWLCFRKRFDFN